MTTRGSEALSDVYAKLDWATSRHGAMVELFREFAYADGGDERPYGFKFDGPDRGMNVIVSFIVEEPVPIEMRLLAADLVHNARVALDHVLARLKDVFGGSPGSGYFPVAVSEEKWVEALKRTKPLKGLDQVARDLIFSEQPLHRDDPLADPLVALNSLDSVDKHELMHVVYAYTGAAEGRDLIQVLQPRAVLDVQSLWHQGDELTDGTRLVQLRVRRHLWRAGCVKAEGDLGFAFGDLKSPRAGTVDMIERVRGIADKAAQLIDAEG